MAHPQAWEQWKADWQHAFFALALGLTTLGALTGPGGGPGPDGVRLGLAAVLGGWYAYWFTARRGARGAGTAHLPYLIGAAVFWAVMAAVDPVLLPVGAAALVPYCMRRPWWAAAGGFTLAAVWLAQRLASEGRVELPAVLGCALGTMAALALAGYITMLDYEGGKRQLLYDELAAAQADREAAQRQAGILAERQRLAREVHDTLTQGFASIAMLLDAALADLPPGGPVPLRVGQAMRTARENLDESRRLVEALRPVQLDGIRLPDAVGRLTARLGDETGIEACVVVTGEAVALGAGVEAELLRVVQEALTNVRRHAAAASVTVTLSYLDEVVVVDVQDDGTGFTTGARRAGVGLTAMAERVDGLGGTLTIESAPGEGTTVAVGVPVHAPPPGPDTAAPGGPGTHSNPGTPSKPSTNGTPSTPGVRSTPGVPDGGSTPPPRRPRLPRLIRLTRTRPTRPSRR